MTDTLLNLLPAIDPVLAHATSAFIAVVLLVSAVDKLRDRDSFADAVANYELLPQPLVGLASRALPLLEAAAGVLLLPVATRPAGALLALALWLVFTAAIAINLRRGRDRIDCGCGGHSHTPLSAGLVVRNLLLMAGTALSAAPLTSRATVWLDLAAVGFATLFLLGLYALANTLLSQHAHLLDLRKSP